MEPGQRAERPMVVKTLRSRTRPGSPRPGRTLFATSIAGLIAATVAVAGCGTQLGPNANPGSGSKHTTVRLAAPSTVVVAVSILNKKGGGGPSHWTLRCQPAGGTAPDPAAACKALLGVRKALTRLTKKPIMCPMIMVSAEQIVLKGKLFGKPVNRVIADGGCDVGIFNSLKNTFY
jgi:hypothetical protein